MGFNNTYLKYTALSLVTVAVCLLSGCGSSKKATGKIPQEVANADTPYGRMIMSYSPWETVSMGVKVRVDSPMSFSISGKAYMENGKNVHVSLRVLGFEVGVLHINSDSAFVVDKIHRVAVAESMEKFRAYTGLDLVQLQDILLGRWLAPGSPEGFVTRGIKYGYAMNDHLDQLASLDVELSSGRKISCQYSGWEECSLGWAPSSISTELAAGGRRYNGAITYSPSSITLDRHDMPAFKLPGGYQRVGVEDFLKTLKTL